MNVTNYLKRRTRALALVGASVLMGTGSLTLSTASSATTVVTNPAKAVVVNGRFAIGVERPDLFPVRETDLGSVAVGETHPRRNLRNR